MVFHRRSQLICQIEMRKNAWNRFTCWQLKHMFLLVLRANELRERPRVPDSEPPNQQVVIKPLRRWKMPMRGRDSISINSTCPILGLLQRFSARISYVNAFMRESKWKFIARNAVHVKCRMHNGDVHFSFVFVSSGYQCEIVQQQKRTKKEFAKYVFLSHATEAAAAVFSSIYLLIRFALFIIEITLCAMCTSTIWTVCDCRCFCCNIFNFIASFTFRTIFHRLLRPTRAIVHCQKMWKIQMNSNRNKNRERARTLLCLSHENQQKKRFASIRAVKIHCAMHFRFIFWFGKIVAFVTRIPTKRLTTSSIDIVVASVWQWQFIVSLSVVGRRWNVLSHFTVWWMTESTPNMKICHVSRVYRCTNMTLTRHDTGHWVRLMSVKWLFIPSSTTISIYWAIFHWRIGVGIEWSLHRRLSICVESKRGPTAKVKPDTDNLS